MSIQKRTPASNLETNATKNKVADGILKLSMDTDVTEIPDELVEVAGKKAIANRFYFGLSGAEGEEIMVTAYPISLWNKTGSSYEREGLVSAVMPDNCGSIAEMTWAFPENVSVAQAAQAMYKAGFQFSAAYQNNEDKKLTAEIKKALSGNFNKKADPKKKKPAPKKKNDNDNGNDTYGRGIDPRGPFGGGGCWGTGRGGMGW